MELSQDRGTGPTELRHGIFECQADGTTLGADNGIGVATALALLDMPLDAKLPPLECLFTVDEETGLTGAFDLDARMLSGMLSHCCITCFHTRNSYRLQGASIK
jgi:dipeptidase D